MKPEDLEQRLARTPRSGPPSIWRTEILAAARTARAETLAESSSASATSRERVDRTQRDPWWAAVAAWLRPNRAWASPWGVLAAGWAVVLAVNGAGAWLERGSPAAVAFASHHHPAPLSSPAAVLLAARNYRAEVVALAERDDAAAEPAPVTEGTPAMPAPPHAPAGRPRTEWDSGRRGAALGAGSRLA